MSRTKSFFSILIFAGMICISGSAFGATPESQGLDEALEKGLKAYDAVRDYKAVFQKQERSGDALGPQETIFLKFEKPFKIFMGWLNTNKKGLQVLYERGKRDGKLAIHKPGLLLGLAPVIFLEQSSPWVREGSASYDIEDAGIGTFLEDFAQAVTRAEKEERLDVKTGEEGSFDVTFKDSTEGSGYFAYRVIVHFDRISGLPDTMQLFDWNNKLTGIYAYEQLKLNVGAEDLEFKQLALGKLYRLYLPAAKPAATKNFASGH